MVKACYEIDGGKAKYKTMRDCARAVCQEEDLKFEDFFPPKPTAAPIDAGGPVEDLTKILQPKLSDDALYGLAGNIVKLIMPQTESHPAGLLVALTEQRSRADIDRLTDVLGRALAAERAGAQASTDGGQGP